jgi:hypothetical protein
MQAYYPDMVEVQENLPYSYYIDEKHRFMKKNS